MKPQKITVETGIHAALKDVWQGYITPNDIMQWNAASEDWHTTTSNVDFTIGGQFSSRMEAKDGSVGFDFAGTYTNIVEHERIEYRLETRMVQVDFIPTSESVIVRVAFDSEPTHSIEQQQLGWQSILDNFAGHMHNKTARPV